MDEKLNLENNKIYENIKIKDYNYENESEGNFTDYIADFDGDEIKRRYITVT
ncbi:hypothetical protein U3516DRAFT_747677 [Neocallimastix sp. 'constans']